MYILLKSDKWENSPVAFGRDEATRTPDPYVPNVVRYQLRYIPISQKSRAKVRTFFELRARKAIKFQKYWKIIAFLGMALLVIMFLELLELVAARHIVGWRAAALEL